MPDLSVAGKGATRVLSLLESRLHKVSELVAKCNLRQSRKRMPSQVQVQLPLQAKLEDSESCLIILTRTEISLLG